ncbi:MAG: SoxR reducing system RseC family protein [Candidatus Omnitrophota bacterium]
MKEEGRVVKVEGGEVTVEVMAAEVCTKCCSCGAAKTRYVTIGEEKAAGLVVGDKVEVEVEASDMMRMYMLLYALPLIVFIAVVFITHAATGSPLLSVLFAIGGIIGSFAAVALYLKKKKPCLTKCAKKQDNAG